MGSIQIVLSLVLVISLGIGIDADYLGRLCGTQWGTAHSYPAGGTKVKDCIAHCHNLTYKYAGMIFGYECFCDNQLDGYALCRNNDTRAPCMAANCNLTSGILCNADDTMICGDTTWYSMYDADKNHNTIWHWDTVVNEVCARDQNPCKWNCHVSDKDYVFQEGFVYGTGVYDIDSSFCLAAAHDLRYIPNENTTVSVARHQSTKRVAQEGSWRYGIQSTWKSTNYTFNVTQPVQNYDFENSYVWGFANLSTRILNCDRFETGSTKSSLFASTVINRKLQSSYTNLPLLENDLYYCALDVEDSRIPATYVPVVTEPNGHGGAVSFRTITVNEGATVEITFQTGSLSNGPWHIQKAGIQLANDASVTRTSVTIANAGFYYLLDNNRAIAATIRLIVVPQAMDLNRCNGIYGVPREDGTCMCFPPWGSSDGKNNCTEICNFPNLDGSFGYDCKQSCHSDDCKALLVCGEDPFGCHCSSGWMGPTCTDKCPKGTFGPDCKGKNTGCHCIGGEDCGHITGLCPLGCVWGWFEDDCKKEGAYLKVAPYVIHEGYSTITVDWKAWNITVDGGTIAPDGYYLEYKLCTKNDSYYTNVTSHLYPFGKSVYSEVVEHLLSATCYDFRVRTSVRHQIQPMPSPSANGTTICGSPVGKLADFEIHVLPHEINVTWTWPKREEWNCDATEIVCRWMTTLTCSRTTIPGNYSRPAKGDGDYADSMSLGLPDFSSTDIECFLSNDGGRDQNGPESHAYDLTPRGMTPGMVDDLQAFDLETGLMLVWSPPVGEQGQVVAYTVAVAGGASEQLNTTKASYLIYKAGLNKQYDVTVTAWNRYGGGVETKANFIYKF